MSFYKGGMAVSLANLQKMMQLGHRNAERLMSKSEEKAGQKPSASEADDMRIDSDDIQYHLHSSSHKPSTLGTVGKILLAGAVGASLAGPIGGAVGAGSQVLNTYFSQGQSASESPATPASSEGLEKFFDLYVGKPKP